MAILRASQLTIGAYVQVRGRRWRIANVRPYEDCEVVTLTGTTPPDTGVERRILTPFDVVEDVGRSRRARVVGPRLWRRACRALLAAETPPGGLRSAADARIQVMPFQLEPALAVLRGMGTRLLLADEVGLGKTIQAGLIASELRARGAIERILVIAPAGLREQWSRELKERFAIDAPGVDARSLRRLAAELPIGVNPWTTVAAAIASVDYLKRAEVLPAAASCRWDLVIVDEAHGVCGDSDRHHAVHQLAATAAYVLLLTATPHSGDRRAFASLRALGAVAADDDLLVFRRSRPDVGMASSRRVHIVRVRLSSDERRMHALLQQYLHAVRAESRDRQGEPWLALSVLHKRAFSSAWSLAQSIDRRRSMLDATGEASRGEQLSLPIGDQLGELILADEAPAWPAELVLADARREQHLLTQLANAARQASSDETKLAVIRRLLRRANEPAIVFTEYRDTLVHVSREIDRPAVVLHGGLSSAERSTALKRFSSGAIPLLLATDAAAEGLNLQLASRLVVNLELPWNPMRLEQRIGRVDRIGQACLVHAFHLVADGTGEIGILERLRARVALAKSDIGAPDPLGADEERENARLAMNGS
jgi:SNF2 family DNA or RNA helicase